MRRMREEVFDGFDGFDGFDDSVRRSKKGQRLILRGVHRPSKPLTPMLVSVRCRVVGVEML